MSRSPVPSSRQVEILTGESAVVIHSVWKCAQTLGFSRRCGESGAARRPLLPATAPTIETKESIVARKYVDCREFPSEMNCTVAIAADSEKELIEAAVQHAVAVHGHKDTPELREQLRSLLKDGTPPVQAPNR
jgi:predicted small metal-binding protein